MAFPHSHTTLPRTLALTYHPHISLCILRTTASGFPYWNTICRSVPSLRPGCTVHFVLYVPWTLDPIIRIQQEPRSQDICSVCPSTSVLAGPLPAEKSRDRPRSLRSPGSGSSKRRYQPNVSIYVTLYLSVVFIPSHAYICPTFLYTFCTDPDPSAFSFSIS